MTCRVIMLSILWVSAKKTICGAKHWLLRHKYGQNVYCTSKYSQDVSLQIVSLSLPRLDLLMEIFGIGKTRHCTARLPPRLVNSYLKLELLSVQSRLLILIMYKMANLETWHKFWLFEQLLPRKTHYMIKFVGKKLWFVLVVCVLQSRKIGISQRKSL